MATKLLICVLWLLPGPPKGKPAKGEPQQVTLQNNTLPGHLTTHDVTRTIRRTTKRVKFTETLIWKQTARLVQCNVAQGDTAKIVCYQMVVDRPASVVKLLEDKKEIKPTPAAARFNLPGGSTKLSSEKRTGRESPTRLPPGDSPQNVILLSLIDAAYWPAKKIDAKHTWTRPIERDDFEGTQTLQFIDLGDLDGKTVSRIAVKVTGKFRGSMAREHRFLKAEGVLYWSRLDQHLSRFEGTASWQRARQQGIEECEMTVDAELRETSQLADDAQAKVKEQMSAFSDALNATNQGTTKDALAACKGFRQSWPDSIWMPAVTELEQQITKASSGADRMGRSQLKETIAKAIVSYEAARTNGDADLLDVTVRAMADVARDYGAILGKLCRDKNEETRATAAFALAFGVQPQDAKAVQKCVDDSSLKVRTMALVGLAAAGNTQADAEMLLRLLDDKEAGIRRRALQAVATCVARENFAVAKLVVKIDRLMVYDKVAGVRADAVEALASIGAPTDVPKLEQALKHELDTEIRGRIDRAIEVLKARG